MTWKARFLQDMVQTEAAEQGLCTESGEEDFSWGREMGRCLLASKELRNWEGLELLLSRAGRVRLERQVPEQLKSAE